MDVMASVLQRTITLHQSRSPRSQDDPNWQRAGPHTLEVNLQVGSWTAQFQSKTTQHRSRMAQVGAKRATRQPN